MHSASIVSPTPDRTDVDRLLLPLQELQRKEMLELTTDELDGRGPINIAQVDWEDLAEFEAL
jgi:hypothetical protein